MGGTKVATMAAKNERRLEVEEKRLEMDAAKEERHPEAKAKFVFAITSLLPLLTSAVAVFVNEKPSSQKTRETTIKEGRVPVMVAVAVDHAKEQAVFLWKTIKEPAIFLPTMFIFLWQATPTSDTAMFFFSTNKLGFQPEFLGRVRLVTSIASLAGVGLYNGFLKNVPLRKMFFWTTIIGCGLSLTQLLFVTGVNKQLGISNEWFAMGDTLILTVLGQPRRPNVQQPLHAENGAENQPIGAENQPQEVAIDAPQVGEQVDGHRQPVVEMQPAEQPTVFDDLQAENPPVMDHWSIVSDRDPRMTSLFWKALFENMGTTLKFSSSFHPQTDGQFEEANSTAFDLLKCYVSEQKAAWEQYLPLVEYAYNNTVHSSTGKAPFEIVEGGKKVPPILYTKDKIFEADCYVEGWQEAYKKVSFMPVLVLSARICPPGVEATLFATLMSISNGGGVSGGLLGAWLTQFLGVTSQNFDNLALLLIICNATSLLPLPLLRLLPSELDIETILAKSGTQFQNNDEHKQS
ncbi:hypothetical protein L7F22_039594 [Adiantum nelumboides]|nr:hypothetical protein [Adiantum nelumboides]